MKKRGSGGPATAIERYVPAQVFSRCGQAVSRLVKAGLVARPEMRSSETEVYEWWLVSAELGTKLRAAGLPVLQLHELHMWGRTATGVPLEEDPDLIAALDPIA